MNFGAKNVEDSDVETLPFDYQHCNEMKSEINKLFKLLFKSSRSKNVCSKWLNFSELGISFLQNTSIYPAIFDPWSEYVFVLNAFFSLAKEFVGQYPISFTKIQDQVHILDWKKSTEKIIYLWKWAWKAGQCILKDVKDEQLLVLIDYTGLHLFNACRKLWNTTTN